MVETEKKEDGRDTKTAALTWFLVILDASHAGDRNDADRARRSLRDIGIHVVVDDLVYSAAQEAHR